MYSLVQFVEDSILYVTPSKGITLIEGDLVWAPYKKMGYYEAKIIAVDNDKSTLMEAMKKEKKKQATAVTKVSETNTNEISLPTSKQTRYKNMRENNTSSDASLGEQKRVGDASGTEVNVGILKNEDNKTNNGARIIIIEDIKIRDNQDQVDYRHETGIGSNSEFLNNTWKEDSELLDMDPRHKEKLFTEDCMESGENSDDSCEMRNDRQIPKGKFRKRNLWTTLEKQITRQFFQKEIQENRCIDNEKVRKFKELYKKEMVSRSIPMIKQWIKKEMIKVQKQKCGVLDKRPRYSTPEKKLLESSLERHSLEGSEPSFQELEDLIAKHDVFQNRTADSLYRKFKHMSRTTAL